MFIYLNGEIVKGEEAKISPFDHGYLYGLGVFETFPVYEGHPFLLDDHLSRLRNGLQELNIKFDIDRTAAISILDKLLAKNGLANARIRLNVSAGPAQVGLDIIEYGNPTFMILVNPLTPYDPSVEKSAVILKTRRNTPEGEFRLKSHHYLNNIIGKRETAGTPGAEGIFLTDKGYLAEAVASNLFWVKNKSLYTPSIETGILNGVIREFVLEVAELLEMPVFEGLFTTDVIMGAEEVFLTNSIQEVVPVKSINGEGTFLGNSGPVTRVFQNVYSRNKKVLWSRKEIIGRRDEL